MQQRRVARNGPPVTLPRPRYLNDKGSPRNYIYMKPDGMPSAEFRKLRRKYFRELTKEAIIEQRRIQYALSTAHHATPGN